MRRQRRLRRRWEEHGVYRFRGPSNHGVDRENGKFRNDSSRRSYFRVEN